MPPRRSEIRDEIVQTSGGYLWNTVRQPRVTCAVCATPAVGYELCSRCRGDRGSFRGDLADVVVPLTYAVAMSQSGFVMRGYKDQRSPEARRRMSRVVSRVLLYGIGIHQRCIEAAAGSRVDVRVAVPSVGSERRGQHPLLEICDRIGATNDALRLLPSGQGETASRVTRGDLFVVDGDVRGRHVMVIDDTWTTGGHVQSAALALRAAGAAVVTAVVAARWINPDFPPTAAFWASHHHRTFDPDQCPVTGGVCP